MDDDPTFPDPSGPAFSEGSGMLGFGPGEAMLVFGLIVAIIVLIGVIGTLRRRRALLDAGLDPRLAPQEQLAARLAQQQRQQQRGGPRPPSELSPGVGGAAAPQRTLEERLRELDDLLRREVITAEEHAKARAEVLRDV